MNKERKEKLLNYLYPTEEIAEFMYCDFYTELALILDKKVCFSQANLTNVTRKNNLKIAREIIAKFLNENALYKNKVYEFFPKTPESVIIDNILYGYTLLVSTNINRGTGADIFKDKRSVCYTIASIIDIM